MATVSEGGDRLAVHGPGIGAGEFRHAMYRRTRLR
jgi:hypothetical protein